MTSVILVFLLMSYCLTLLKFIVYALTSENVVYLLFQLLNNGDTNDINYSHYEFSFMQHTHDAFKIEYANFAYTNMK